MLAVAGQPAGDGWAFEFTWDGIRAPVAVAGDRVRITTTLVAPFSPRPAPHAPVSVPVTWDRLDDPDLRPDRWTMRSVPVHPTV